IVVFNNRVLGMVRLEMQVAGYLDWETDMVNPDFKKLAEAMGLTAFEVEDTEAVETVFKEFLAEEGPALINVFTDPDALSMPPNVTIYQMECFAKTMGKLMLNGKTAEIIDMAKSDMKYLRELF